MWLFKQMRIIGSSILWILLEGVFILWWFNIEPPEPYTLSIEEPLVGSFIISAAFFWVVSLVILMLEIEEHEYWELKAMLISVPSAPPDVVASIERALHKGKITRSEYLSIMNKYSKFKESNKAQAKMREKERTKEGLRVELSQALTGGASS